MTLRRSKTREIELLADGTDAHLNAQKELQRIALACSLCNYGRFITANYGRFIKAHYGRCTSQ